jgi:RimJ/RimL family protein N-acetyltransferase
MRPLSEHPAVIRRFAAESSIGLTRLRLATVDDAAFILALRLDPSRNAHLSQTSGDLSAQTRWMENYAERFESGREAYFIIRHHDSDVGTVRLYDYRSEDDSFCWGSWIIRPGTSPSSAIASVALIYDLAFDGLGFLKGRLDVRQENHSVWAFHERYGSTLVGKDDHNRYYQITPGDYSRHRQALRRLGGSRPD